MAIYSLTFNDKPVSVNQPENRAVYERSLLNQIKEKYNIVEGSPPARVFFSLIMSNAPTMSKWHSRVRPLCALFVFFSLLFGSLLTYSYLCPQEC